MLCNDILFFLSLTELSCVEQTGMLVANAGMALQKINNKLHIEILHLLSGTHNNFLYLGRKWRSVGKVHVTNANLLKSPRKPQ